MEGNKKPRPGGAPSIKRTPTVKRGPVPPRVAGNRPAAAKPSGSPKVSPNVTKGAPKVSAPKGKGKPAVPPMKGKGKPVPGAGAVKNPAMPEKSGNRKIWTIVIIAIVLLVVVIGAFVAPVGENGQTLMSSVFENSASQDGGGDVVIVDEETIIEEDVEATEEDLAIEEGGLIVEDQEEVTLPENNDEPVSTPAKETPAPKVEESRPAPVITGDMISSRTGRHYLIVGSFSVQDNATRMQQKLGGSSKIIAPSGGGSLYKVSVSDYGSLQEANNNLGNYMEKHGVDIWVLSY